MSKAMRWSAAALCVGAVFGWFVASPHAQERPAEKPAVEPTKVDPSVEEATKLEAELTKYNDTAPESADVMVKLIDLYHEHARVFGLIRVGQRFIAAHPQDARHKTAMLKLMDGLEATSRNKELTVVCRQFLAKFGDTPEAAAVEIRLGNTLVEMNDFPGAGEAYRAVWKRKPAVENRDYGVKAISNYVQSGDKNVFTQGAALAEEMVEVLPAGEFATHVGWQAIHQWRRGSEWAKSNLAAQKMLKKGIPADQPGLRDLHYYMAENFGNLGQHANAVESLKKLRAIKDDMPSHYQQILRMHYMGAKSAEVAPVVNEFVQKYPDRAERFAARSYLAQAHFRSEERPQALAILAELLPFDATTNNNASTYVQANVQEPAKFAEMERVLTDAIGRNPAHAYWLRYTLAFELQRDRLKDVAKAKATLRELIAKSPSNDTYTTTPCDWLLTTAADDAEFQADVQRILACRRENLDYGNIVVFPTNWIANNRANKDLKTRVAYLQEELKKQDADPIVKAFLHIGNSQARSGEQHRDFLMKPENFSKLNDRAAVYVGRMQGEYYWYYAGNKQKQASGAVTIVAKRVPTDFYAAYHALYTATDYNPPEVQQEALIHLLKVEPTVQVPDCFYRMGLAVDRSGSAELGKQVNAWILKSQQKFGKDPTYASFLGDVFAKLKLQNEAVAYWTTYATFNPLHSESAACAGRLLALKTDAEKPAYIQELLKNDTDYHGLYSEWLATEQYKANNLDAWEKTMRDARKRQNERPFRPWTATDNVAQTWLDTWRAKMDATEADKRRVYQLVADLDVLRASGCARAALMEITPDDGKNPIGRLLAWQSPPRWMYNDSHDWDRLTPYVQSALARKDYMAAATLLTSMLSNISYVEEGRKKSGRDMVAQSYARVGAAGLIIDEKSPIAPLMQAALYLRLGDEALAFDTYAANKALFDEHRDEVPPDLILFVSESLIAAGGDENHNRVEDVLRSWLVKNAESQVVEDLLKARVKLLLARNFFKAQRYDLARTEFMTVINQHPNTPQAIEAEFGIGETFMAQKVYDQAQTVFDKLAQSRESEVIVRAEFLRGVLAHRRGDRDEARDIFRAVLDKVPNIELANQALYNLSEVYGAEERYIDQLNLLRTVGRLGRASKRFHAPGTALSIVVQDSDLGISRGHNRIPVRVTTEPGGDSEMIYLTSGGAGKGLFRADVETRLGEVTPNDHVLQITGKDVIKCDYPDEFKAEFKSVPLSDVEIKIASDGKFEIASSKIVDKQEESFSDQLRREQLDDPDRDRRVGVGRPADQVKPGNIVYLRVQDGDRDMTSEADKITVKLAADSGDQVQVTLLETGAHSGIFEGTIKTAELPAGALASDTSIQHSPLMAIDRDPASYWLSEPDGATPKWLSVDMKDLKLVSRVRIFTPQPDKHAPVRGTILGSNDGLYWFRLASNPLDVPVQPAYAESGRMTRRVYLGNYTGATDWAQIQALARNAKPLTEEEADELSWVIPPDADHLKQPHTVIWSGKYVQERAGAIRIHVNAPRTAIVVDGMLELPLGPGGRFADVWLESGLHDVTIMAATTTPDQPMAALVSKSDPNRAQIFLEPFRASDFDLETPVAKRVAEHNITKEAPKVSVAEKSWEFAFPSVELRHVKFIIHEYLGEAVAINQIQIAGEEEDEVYVPTETDVLALSSNNELEIAGGDVVTATYADELTQGEGGRSRLLTSKLTATYFNGVTTPIAYDFVRQPNGAVVEVRKQLMRIDPGERIIVEIIDFDRDESDEPDTLKFQVAVNDGEPIELVATETEKYSGRFTKEVDTSAKKEDGKLQVKAGDRIYCRYLDSQNTFPGHSVPREAVIYVNEPTSGQIRIYETRVIPAPAESKAPPQIVYRAPAKGQATTGVAFEAPLTIEVIDPDAAKDSRSSVIVKLQTSDGATVDVKCVVSDAFSTASTQYGGYYNPYYGYNNDVRALQEGRFIGQVIMQLGGKNSQQTVPLTSEMPRNLIGGPAMEEDEQKSALDKTLVTKVLNLTGKDTITAGYADALRPRAAKGQLLTAKGRLIANGQLACTDRDYQKPVTHLHVGEKLFLMVTDYDGDASDERDTVQVEVTTDRGEKETATLEETLAHSGIFTGSIFLKPSDMPKPGNFNPEEPAVEAYFGDNLTVKYIDKAASTENGTLEVSVDLPVVVGTDGLVAAFSKTFNDEKLAVETKFHVAESYFELFKSHKKLGRDAEQKEDLEAGRRVLHEVMEDYPDPKYVPRIAYLLGQFAQELGQLDEAVQSYDMIVQQFPEHPLAADAQYKMAQAYEESGSFDQALEAYVTLAATYPKSPLIPNVMIRISDHFYKAEKYEISAQVGEKFLERFDTHQYASRIAFRVGQCYYKSKKFPKAGQAFDSFGKKFSDDALASDALFWSGEAFRMGNNNVEAFRRYNRCRWDYPSSEAAKYARGRLALPEMLQQFEAEANSLDNQ
ncbi:MAG: tetratricopeptide repeat protein [Planctomycetaceae bacterium]|nr:tetratricopeptide repeat protein [Planctomycetaceae bacterium]